MSSRQTQSLLQARPFGEVRADEQRSDAGTDVRPPTLRHFLGYADDCTSAMSESCRSIVAHDILSHNASDDACSSEESESGISTCPVLQNSVALAYASPSSESESGFPTRSGLQNSFALAGDPVEHVQCAAGLQWPCFSLRELDEDVLTNIRSLAHDAAGISKRRLCALSFWERRAVELEPQRQAFMSELPPRMAATVRKLHIPLLAEMCSAAGHEDARLTSDIVRGFPVVGAMDAGGVGTRVAGGLRTGGRPAGGHVPDLAALRAQCRQRNEETLRRATPGPHAAGVWQRTKKERAAGTVGPFVPIEQVDLDEVLLVRRFGVVQDSPLGQKVRPIDDFKGNDANAYTVAWETVSNDREDVLSAAILRLQRELHRVDLRESVAVGLEDYVGAYRTLAPRADQRWLMKLLVYDTDNEAWCVCELLAMPFGAVGGVLAWWRCATAFRTILRRLFELIVFYYVDDVHQIELSSTGRAGRHVFCRVMELLGWGLDPDKSQPPSQRATSLGCTLEIGRAGLTWSLTEHKRLRWLGDIRRALDEDRLTSADASQLHGRLAFGAQRVFARVGRAALRPICWQQRGGGSTRLTARVRSALLWWQDFLASSPEASLAWRGSCSAVADFLMYTDAENTGHIGVVLVSVASGECWYSDDVVPKCIQSNLLPRRTQINVFELAAVLCGVHTYLPLLRGRRVAAFVDNQAALNMIIKGASPKEDANGMLFTIWQALARESVSTHWEYVPSKLNIADGPSRSQFALLDKLGATRVAAAWPAVAGC